MSEATSFRDVIELWASREAMAVATGAGAWAVSKWWQRDSIPADWWAAVLATDLARANGVTAEAMASFAARHSPPAETVTEARPA